MSNEKQIRELMRSYLYRQYPSAKVRDEFSGNTDVRNDLFAVTETNIISVEIKSDKDNFSRLDKQLSRYLTFSNIVYLAIDQKHYEKYLKQFSEKEYFKKVGIFIFDGEKLQQKKKPIILKIPNLYTMLMSRQLTFFFMYFKGKSKIKKDYNTSLYLIKKLFTKNEIYEISKQIFINNNREYECWFEKDIIKDFNNKQEKFKSFYENEKLMKDVYWGRTE